MKHEINKNKMRNDIVLTIALVISIILTEIMMHFTNLANSAIAFFLFAFILTKITYHIILKIAYIKKWILK